CARSFYYYGGGYAMDYW
nr:immunoglobulin heavy chain junction region [Mus musculus]MBK4184029.1 immunoglobulin heavy chain junction region [Mus musculus]